MRLTLLDDSDSVILGDKAPKEGTVDDESWISKVFTVVNHLDDDSKRVTSLSEPNQEEQLLLQQAHKTIDRLRQVRRSQLTFYYIYLLQIRSMVR
jgi:hypothetical protein